MEVGFVLDQAHGKRCVSAWIEGSPNKSIWFGVKMPSRKPIEIVTQRCRRCGFLENYAPEV